MYCTLPLNYTHTQGKLVPHSILALVLKLMHGRGSHKAAIRLPLPSIGRMVLSPPQNITANAN